MGIDELKQLINQDKRKADRINLRLTVSCCYSEKSPLKWSKSRAIDNISGTGIKIKLKEPLKKNKKIILKINILDDQVPVIVRAKTAWQKKSGTYYETGLKFLKMPYKDRKRYLDYLTDKILSSYLAPKTGIANLCH